MSIHAVDAIAYPQGKQWAFYLEGVRRPDALDSAEVQPVWTAEDRDTIAPLARLHAAEALGTDPTSIHITVMWKLTRPAGNGSSVAENAAALRTAAVPRPIFITTRLTIGLLTPADLNDVVAYRSDNEYLRWWGPDRSDPARIRSELQQTEAEALPDPDGFHLWAIRDPKSRELHGELQVGRFKQDATCFWLGYALRPASRGRGIATEAARGALTYLFEEAAARRITAECDTRNTPSRHVLEKIGMRYEGTEQQVEETADGWASSHLFALLSEEYFVDDNLRLPLLLRTPDQPATRGTPEKGKP